MWNLEVISIVTTDPTHKPIQRMLSSYLPRRAYGRLSSFSKEAFSSSASFPADLLGWEVLADRFRTESSYCWGSILATFQYLASVGVPSPPELASFHSADFYALPKCSPSQLFYALYGRWRVLIVLFPRQLNTSNPNKVYLPRILWYLP